MKQKLVLSTQEAVDAINDTGVTEWAGSHVRKVEMGAQHDTVVVHLNDEHLPTYTMTGWMLLEAFNEYADEMTWQVTRGYLHDLDFDAETADSIIQTAVYGEVKFA